MQLNRQSVAAFGGPSHFEHKVRAIHTIHVFVFCEQRHRAWHYSSNYDRTTKLEVYPEDRSTRAPRLKQ